MRIACLAFTPFWLDGRVQRTVTALEEAGHRTLVVAQAPFPEHGFADRHVLPPRPHPVLQRLTFVLRDAPANVLPRLAEPLYWTTRERRTALDAIARFRPDVIVCNDALALPVGTALKRRFGTRIVYDSHEFATQQHIQNWKWRLVAHAAVRQLESHHIGGADLVTTVSEGIADALMALYGLARRPTVVRNLPSFQAVAERPPASPPSVLFHGLICAERGLEELIDCLASARFGGTVVIRGYGAQPYLDGLAARAAARGVADRVRFSPAVPPAALVVAASEADIGYLALPETTDQYRFALPNKLFEYAMAGLAIVATPRNESAQFIERTGIGIVTEGTPAALAATLDRLDGEALSRMRRAALATVRDHNWAHEKARLIDSIESMNR